MRKPRDFDSELKALADKAKLLKDHQVRQLGELVVACRADALPIGMLAGALLGAASMTDTATKEGWSKTGTAFFRNTRPSRRRPRAEPEGGAEREGDGASA